MTDVTALVLAAGAGRRYGGPKTLARSADGTAWLTTVTALLESAGLEIVAVLPDAHPETADLLPPGARPLFVDTFAEGIGASLRAGLTDLSETDARAALVTLVDQPALPRTVVDRVLSPAHRVEESRPSSTFATWDSDDLTPQLLDPAGGKWGDDTTLRRATFGGRPGHPVLIGRAHWAALIDSLRGDEGAGPYFHEHRGERVECGDLWDGADIDERTGAAGG